MNICLVVSDFPPRRGGISTFNYALAQELSKRVEVTHVLVISLEKTKEESVISEKLTIRRIQRGGFVANFFFIARALWQARSYDLFHSPNIFPVGFFTLIVSKYLLRKPVVITFHGTDMLTQDGSMLTQFAKKYTVLHASATTSVSHSTARLVAERLGVHEGQFRVVYHLLPEKKSVPVVGHMRERYGYTKEDIVVLSVGNLVRRKGFDDLIHATALLTNEQIKLLIVGDGPERASLEALTKELGLGARVRFAGRIDQLEECYTEANIFVLASRYIKEEGDIEGLGVVLLEAQQHGLPVVATRSGGIPEALLDGKTGILVEEHAPNALAAAIEQLADNPQLRKEMGERGQTFVAERFGTSHNAARYTELYQGLIRHS